MVISFPLGHRVPPGKMLGAAVGKTLQIGGSFSVRPARLLESRKVGQKDVKGFFEQGARTTWR
jgi:hypothetical protein